MTMATKLTHIVTDEAGAELWREPYIFGSLYAAGQSFVQDYVGYGVVSCVLDGDVVRTVVTKGQASSIKPRTERDPSDLASALASREMLRRENESLRSALAEALDMLAAIPYEVETPSGVQAFDVPGRREADARIASLRAKFLGGETPPAPSSLIADWRTWTPERRLEFLAQLECCRSCGDLDPRCQCDNDE
jgi:hypothetical protein